MLLITLVKLYPSYENIYDCTSMCWPFVIWAQTSNEANINENGTYVHFYHDHGRPAKAKKEIS